MFAVPSVKDLGPVNISVDIWSTKYSGSKMHVWVTPAGAWYLYWGNLTSPCLLLSPFNSLLPQEYKPWNLLGAYSSVASATAPHSNRSWDTGWFQLMDTHHFVSCLCCVGWCPCQPSCRWPGTALRGALQSGGCLSPHQVGSSKVGSEFQGCWEPTATISPSGVLPTPES